jgi:hypothetical protein
LGCQLCHCPCHPLVRYEAKPFGYKANMANSYYLELLHHVTPADLPRRINCCIQIQICSWGSCKATGFDRQAKIHCYWKMPSVFGPKLCNHYWMHCDAAGTQYFLIASSLQWYAVWGPRSITKPKIIHHCNCAMFFLTQSTTTKHWAIFDKRVNVFHTRYQIKSILIYGSALKELQEETTLTKNKIDIQYPFC